MIRVSAALSILALAVAACAPGAPATSEASAMATPSSQSTGLTLTSPAFADGDPIPRQHTCRGEDISPALAWSGVPGGTAALALFVDDPDGRDWVHWTVLDLPGTDGDLPAASRRRRTRRSRGETTSGASGTAAPARPRATTTTASRSTRSRHPWAFRATRTARLSGRRSRGRPSWPARPSSERSGPERRQPRAGGRWARAPVGPPAHAPLRVRRAGIRRPRRAARTHRRLVRSVWCRDIPDTRLPAGRTIPWGWI